MLSLWSGPKFWILSFCKELTSSKNCWNRKKSISIFGVTFVICTCCQLTLSQTSPGFYVSAVQLYYPFENTVGKGEIARNEQFLFFPQCFLPVWRSFCHFHQIWYCRLQTLSVWKSLKFVVWERFRTLKLCCLVKSYPPFCHRMTQFFYSYF